MGKYFETADLEPEIRRLLIQEFGTLKEAKKDMDVFSKHLPEKLQLELKSYVIDKYPKFKNAPDELRVCMADVNKSVQIILAGLY